MCDLTYVYTFIIDILFNIVFFVLLVYINCKYKFDFVSNLLHDRIIIKKNKIIGELCSSRVTQTASLFLNMKFILLRLCATRVFPLGSKERENQGLIKFPLRVAISNQRDDG